jgi:rod shape-determining protein MreD
VNGAALARARVAAVLFVAIVIQTTLLAGVRPDGVAPDLMLVVAISAGLAGGPELGAQIGFAAGLLTDLFVQSTPLGLNALTLCLVGYAVGALQHTMLRAGWWLPPAVGLVGSAGAVLLFVAAGITVGQTQLTALGPARLFEIAGLVGVMNSILAVPVSRVVTWAAAGSAGAALVRQSQQDRSAVR